MHARLWHWQGSTILSMVLYSMISIQKKRTEFYFVSICLQFHNKGCQTPQSAKQERERARERTRGLKQDSRLRSVVSTISFSLVFVYSELANWQKLQTFASLLALANKSLSVLQTAVCRQLWREGRISFQRVDRTISTLHCSMCFLISNTATGVFLPWESDGYQKCLNERSQGASICLFSFEDESMHVSCTRVLQYEACESHTSKQARKKPSRPSTLDTFMCNLKLSLPLRCADTLLPPKDLHY